MMEWMGGTISKEDLGEDGGHSRNKRRRDDDNEEEALGAFALRFKYVLCYDFLISLFKLLPTGTWSFSQIPKHFFKPTLQKTPS
jgi:hypothetical protein